MERGYRTFAYEGPQGLKVERLASEVGKNKSSFYHHFAEVEVFISRLLRYHLEQAKVMAAKEAEIKSLDDLVETIIEHKVDMLFNRQLRIHRENPEFHECFMKTNQMTAESFAPLWAKLLELDDNAQLAGLVLKLSMENFYLQITDETLNSHWLRAYFEGFRELVRAFKSNGDRKALNGTV